MLTFFREFIASLRTGGGRIFVSLFLVIFFTAVIVLLAYYPPEIKDISKDISGLVLLFGGVLAGSLRGNIPKNGNGVPVNDPGEH